MASGMGGEFQYCWSAHAPMGDEEWTFRLELCSLNTHEDRFHYRSHQFLECLVGYVEGEEGRDGSLYRMT